MKSNEVLFNEPVKVLKEITNNLPLSAFSMTMEKGDHDKVVGDEAIIQGENK